ncbi:MAG TPA: family 16 glycoside hydrolase [Blastocatellia bacterium]|nr:family 16 glycoside hydrolase [Blastocatellia bacterium]
MNIGLTSPDTDFSRDALGRYVLNTFDEMLVTIDANARNSAGLPPRGDLRPFDFIIIGGGTFGAAVAEQLWFRSASRSERILVLEGGPFLLPEHVQNLPALGLNAGGARMDHQPQAEVWGLAWNAGIPFPGLAYCIGGRSVYWGGWSPRLLDSELPNSVWPQPVLDDLRPKTLPDGRKGYFRQSSDQIGVTETNDFIFGELHHAMRRRLFEALSGTEVSDAMDLTGLPDHPAVEYRDTPATLAELAAMLGIDLPSPPPTEQELRNLLKLEAPLAVQGQSGHAGFFPFNKFSTVPLLTKAAREAQTESGGDDVKKRVMIVPRCHVIRLNTVDDGGKKRVSEVVTERGPVPVSQDAKVIIALGTIESTRLALLSFGSDGKIGTNLMAHLRSNVDIRVPRTALASLPATAKALEASALLVKGEHQFKKPDGTPDGFAHFHFQITASGLGAGGNNSEAELFKKIPDIDTFDAHKHATDTHVVITIRGIGEMQPHNSASNVTLDLNPQQNDEFQTRRAFVNLQASTRDMALWDAMDKASDDVAHAFGGGLEFEVFTPQGIKKAKPASAGQPRTDLKTLLFYTPNNDPNPANRGRRDGLGTTHHEAGTLRMGENANTSVTDPNCRFHNVTNTYVAGPALFPTIGSPNPMLTGIALARRLGDHLMPDPPPAKPEPGFVYLFDGTASQFADWEMAGGGSFLRLGRTMIARQDNRGIGLLFYKPQQFENFILRLDFLLPHPRGANNDNSGVFVRFRDPRLPDPAPNPVDPPGNAAFVAVHTGFEVQIDEEARGDTRFNEPDGSFFARTGAIYKITSPGTGVGQQNYQNTSNLAARRWHSYEIEVNNQDYIVRLNGQEATRFRRAPSDVRGKPPSVDPHSGFIGVQTHTGNVAFANIRIKTL